MWHDVPLRQSVGDEMGIRPTEGTYGHFFIHGRESVPPSAHPIMLVIYRVNEKQRRSTRWGPTTVQLLYLPTRLSGGL